MSDTIPKKDMSKPVSISLRTREALLEDLDAVAKEQGYSRAELIDHLLRTGLRRHHEEEEEIPEREPTGGKK